MSTLHYLGVKCGQREHLCFGHGINCIRAKPKRAFYIAFIIIQIVSIKISNRLIPLHTTKQLLPCMPVLLKLTLCFCHIHSVSRDLHMYSIKGNKSDTFKSQPMHCQNKHFIFNTNIMPHIILSNSIFKIPQMSIFLCI